MSKLVNRKNIIIVGSVLIVLISILLFLLSKDEMSREEKLFEIRIDESSLWKTSVEYSPDYSTTVHLEKDSFLRILSNNDNVYYYSTNNSVATIGFDGTVNIHGTGECIIYGATEKENEGLSNYIKLVVK